MPTPASGQISMSDVNAETNLTQSMSNFFSSSLIGGAGGLMYHNLAMASGNTLTAKAAIYDPYVAGAGGTSANLLLSNWYNYSQTPYGIMTFSLTNNNLENNIDVTIYLRDPTGPTDYQIGNPVPVIFNLNANSGTASYPDYDTGIAMNTTNFTAGIYQIVFDISAIYVGPPPPPGGGVLGNSTSASDTDNVGAGTARVTTNPPNFDATSPITGTALVRGNITGSAGIHINKRTTFDIIFN